LNEHKWRQMREKIDRKLESSLSSLKSWERREKADVYRGWIAALEWVLKLEEGNAGTE